MTDVKTLDPTDHDVQVLGDEHPRLIRSNDVPFIVGEDKYGCLAIVRVAPSDGDGPDYIEAGDHVTLVPPAVEELTDVIEEIF